MEFFFRQKFTLLYAFDQENQESLFALGWMATQSQMIEILSCLNLNSSICFLHSCFSISLNVSICSCFEFYSQFWIVFPFSINFLYEISRSSTNSCFQFLIFSHPQINSCFSSWINFYSFQSRSNGVIYSLLIVYFFEKNDFGFSFCMAIFLPRLGLQIASLKRFDFSSVPKDSWSVCSSFFSFCRENDFGFSFCMGIFSPRQVLRIVSLKRFDFSSERKDFWSECNFFSSFCRENDFGCVNMISCRLVLVILFCCGNCRRMQNYLRIGYDFENVTCCLLTTRNCFKKNRYQKINLFLSSFLNLASNDFHIFFVVFFLIKFLQIKIFECDFLVSTLLRAIETIFAFISLAKNLGLKCRCRMVKLIQPDVRNIKIKPNHSLPHLADKRPPSKRRRLFITYLSESDEDESLDLGLGLNEVGGGDGGKGGTSGIAISSTLTGGIS